MTFQTLLNTYLNEAKLSQTKLAELSGLSKTTISRYCNGSRVPDRNSEALETLCHVLSDYVNEDETNLLDKFSACLPDDVTSLPSFNIHLDELIELIGINVNDLARSMNFDPSYISRIRKGERHPHNIDEFIDQLVNYILKKYDDPTSIEKLQGLVQNNQDIKSGLIHWFGSEVITKQPPINHFLNTLNDFDLDAYIESIHFNDIKVPTLPFQLPANKQYYGLEGMKQGEIDFFKHTVLNKSMDDIYMCSDMDMADMSEDVDFGKKWMMAIAMSIRKGHHINIIHNVDRPFEEMMVGLESWIPIYMTGQVSPYHLKSVENHIYQHLNYVSHSVALTGECITGHHSDGKYYLTTSKEELAYYHKKIKHLFNKALPLMEIFRQDQMDELEARYNTLLKEQGEHEIIYTSLPIYTLSEDLLREILKDNDIHDKSRIMAYYHNSRDMMLMSLEHHALDVKFYDISKESFATQPMTLDLSGIFMDKEVSYTYEQYQKHLELSKTFHSNYHFSTVHTKGFRNIQMHILKDHWVLITKIKSPTIHFIIRHPKMVEAIQNYEPPIIDER